jgi:hypothetical protein
MELVDELERVRGGGDDARRREEDDDDEAEEAFGNLMAQMAQGSFAPFCHICSRKHVCLPWLSRCRELARRSARLAA